MVLEIRMIWRLHGLGHVRAFESGPTGLGCIKTAFKAAFSFRCTDFSKKLYHPRKPKVYSFVVLCKRSHDLE